MIDGAAQRRTAILDSIAGAAKTARRDRQDVQLIAVTKGRSTAEIEPLIAAGQRDFGENRVQEARAKWAPLLERHPEVRLHEIGQLQSNKAAEAASLFSTIHSVDRPSLLDALDKVSNGAGTRPSIYLQVNIGEEPQKGGCAIDDLETLVTAARETRLDLLGLMAIPPLGVEPAPYFALLAKLARANGLTGLSMGMSSDYRQAVMLGATAVRIGTALLED